MSLNCARWLSGGASEVDLQALKVRLEEPGLPVAGRTVYLVL